MQLKALNAPARAKQVEASKQAKGAADSSSAAATASTNSQQRTT